MIYDAGLPRGKYLTDEWTFGAITIGKEYLSWHSPVYVKADMNFGLFATAHYQ